MAPRPDPRKKHDPAREVLEGCGEGCFEGCLGCLLPFGSLLLVVLMLWQPV